MSSTMTLDLSDLESGWGEGTPLVDQETGLTIRAPASVPFGNTFLAVGGNLDFNVNSDRIYKYDAVSGGWNLLPTRLFEPASYIEAVLLPEDYFPCGAA